MSSGPRSPLARVVTLLSFALVAACADTEPRAAAPTAPDARVAASVTAADSTTGEILALSEDAPPVCKAYLDQRNALKLRLAAAPGDEDTIESIALINGFLSDNCR